MKILLTGAKGNLGQALIEQSQTEIVQLNRDDWKNDFDVKLANGIDVVIHAASDLRSQAALSPTKLIDSNVASTARLLEAMRQYKIPRLIFLSSCAVYGEDMRTNEDNLCCPISINGIGKLLNERVIAEFCSEHDIKYEILRVFNMYGGTDHFSIISHIKNALENNLPFTLYNEGVAQRDFIHVADVARIVLLLLHNKNSYTHLNVGTGIATKISALIEIVSERFSNLRINHTKRQEAEYSRADISRLLELGSFEFLRVEDYLQKEFMNEYNDI